jgi:hypothetical protein
MAATETEFEKILHALEALTREEIVGLVTARLPADEAAAYAAVAGNLSIETLRVLSARALLRARQ